MNFPLKTELFQTPIQLIMSMYTQIMGFDHDKGIPESFLAFLLFLSESTLFEYPKFIAEFIHEQFNKFSSLTTFRYQS